MCVIIVTSKVIPSLEVFKDCESANGHGGGIAWKKGGLVHWKKGIDAEEVYKIAKREGPGVVAHFRISTIGGQIKELCHPFPVTNKCSNELEGSSERVIFHNGHFSDWDKLMVQMSTIKNLRIPGGDWSDSRGIAWIINHSNSSFLRMTSQKVVVMDGKSTDSYYGEWSELDGTHYSNLGWRYKAPPVGFYQSDVWDNYGVKSEPYPKLRITAAEKRALIEEMHAQSELYK